MYISSHHFHRQFVYRRVGSGLWLAGVLRFMGQSMLLVFLLVYLFDLGFAPSIIFSYGVVFHLASLAWNHWVIGHLVAALGSRKTIAVSNGVLVLFAIGLYSLPLSLIYLYPLAVIQSFAIGSYILSENAYLASTATASQAGAQVGRQLSAQPVGFLLGALTGGLVAWLWSPQINNLTAALVLIIGGLLAFIHHDTTVKSRHRYSRRRVGQIYRQLARDWRNPLMVAGAAFFESIYNFWMFYIGIFLLSAAESGSGYGLLGIFACVGALFGILTARQVGQQLDRGQEQRLIHRAVIGETVIHVGRMAIAFVPWAAGMVLHGLTTLAGWIPYEARNISIYRRAYQGAVHFADASAEYAVCLENIGIICRLLLFSLASIVALFWSLESTLLVCLASVFIVNLVFLLPLPAQD